MPISEMLRNTALAGDFMRRHGDPAATKSLDVHVILQKLSLEVNPSAGFWGYNGESSEELTGNWLIVSTDILPVLSEERKIKPKSSRSD